MEARFMSLKPLCSVVLISLASLSPISAMAAEHAHAKKPNAPVVNNKRANNKKALKPPTAMLKAVATKKPKKVAVATNATKPANAKLNATKVAAKACLHAPIDLVRGEETTHFALTRCDGRIAPLAVERLSLIARPNGALRPQNGIERLALKKGEKLAPNVRRVDSRLVHRIQAVVDHFSSKGHARPRVYVVSGYRPTSTGSFHADGKAIDFRLDGVTNESLVAYCKTLNDTGCGYYPNSAFIHLDVRPQGAGHVAWIDASGAGESARYVSAWPPSPNDVPVAMTLRPFKSINDLITVDSESMQPREDEHPATPHRRAEARVSVNAKQVGHGAL